MTEWTFHIRKGVKWVDKNGEEVADVTANDWVATAKYVNDAVNDSGSQYMYDTGSVVHNAQAYYDYTAYLLESENGTKTTDADGDPIEVVEEVKPEDIGVKAVDDYTLVYTLDQPCPFFLSVLSYTSFMPVYGPFLEEMGDQFGLDADSLLYNGAYILSSFEPQYERVLTKNPTYWDKDNVLIDEIRETYNAEANSVAASMYQAGEVDYLSVSSDLLDSMLKDESTKDKIHASRVDNAFSYFYCFNFDPQFDAVYEPDNWKIAVNNENFRKAIMAGMDRVKALTVSDPYNPEKLLNNTVTPANFAVGAGKDFTQYDAVKPYTDGDSFDAAKAVEYRDAAKAELTAAGATFPIKVLMPYNPSTSNWDKECQVVEQQLESLLGADFIDIIVEAGPSSGFLKEIRRSGKYALLKCNWGPDYADPNTYTDPFYDGSYNWPELAQGYNDENGRSQYYNLVDAARAITNDLSARYEAFAEAEAFLINKAFLIPFGYGTGGYDASRLNPFESQFAPFGISRERYKGQSVMEKPMNTDEYFEAYDQWEEDRAALAGK